MQQLKKIGEVRAYHSSEIAESRIGIGFEKLDRAVFDPAKAYDKIAAIGVKWIRIQSGWARTEKVKNVYDFAWLDDIVDNLLQRGLQPWMCLCYGNGLYDEAAAQIFGAVGCPPIHTAEQRTAWANYVAALTARYQGKIVWYEVWNEPDGKWCWKHGPSGSEYGNFVKATAAAVRAGDPAAKVIGGSMCLHDLNWLNAMLQTGAGAVIDAFTYHGYTPDETQSSWQWRPEQALLKMYNPKIELIQGETGAQSRDDGCGAMAGAAWTPERQARFVARHLVKHLLEDVKFTCYFSSLDMIEALNGRVGDKASYLDYGYFGVLAADFDENGFATGEYTPKLSYRTLQVLSAIFQGDFTPVELPVRQLEGKHSPRLMHQDENRHDMITGGFRRPDGSAAFVYWKYAELLTSTCDSTISLEAVNLAGPVRLIRILTGEIFEIPAERCITSAAGVTTFVNLPLYDDPMMLTFGNFCR